MASFLRVARAAAWDATKRCSCAMVKANSGMSHHWSTPLQTDSLSLQERIRKTILDIEDRKRAARKQLALDEDADMLRSRLSV